MRETRRYLWAGWLLLAELDGSDNVVRKQTWGLDLAGLNGAVNSREAAGGIGGLLAIEQAAVGGGSTQGGLDAVDLVVLGDANGNVTQLVAWASGYGGAVGFGWHTDRLAAHYEYTPYGSTVNDPANAAASGAYAAENPWRFSTKQFDPETGHIYAKERYYQPDEGRWLSADPFAELGHVLVKRAAQGRDWLGEAEAIAIFNAYDYVRNDPLAAVDPFGEIYWRSGDQFCGPGVLSLVGKWCASMDEFDAAAAAFWGTAKKQLECFLNCELTMHAVVCPCTAAAVCPIPCGKKIAESLGLRVLGRSPNTTMGRMLASLLTQKLGPRMDCAKVTGQFMHRVLNSVKRLRLGPSLAKTFVVAECGIAIGCSAYCLYQGW